MLTGAKVVLPTGTVPDGRVTVTGTKITSAARHGTGQDTAHGPGASDVSGALDVLDVSGHWLVPGFVDLHNHGGGGASFSGSAQDVLKAIRTHRSHGTTTLVASTVTDDMDVLVRQAGLLSELAEQGDLAGIHFEGPFISPAARARTPRRCCATPTRRRCASWSTQHAARPGWSPSRPNCRAAWTPYGCWPSTA